MDKARLLGSYWTLATGACPWTDQEYVDVDFRHRVECASAAGFRGLGLLGVDIAHINKSYSYADMRSILRDNGIETIEIELLLNWYGQGPARIQSDKERQFLLQAAEELDARHLKVADFYNFSVGIEQLAEELATLGKAAEEHNTIVLFEIVPPMFSNICSLDRGLELIFKAACGNCGLMLDSWHLEHIRASPAEIREKISSAEIPIGVEINDGVIWPDAELAEATVHNRLLPGEGRFDLTGFLGVMEQVGYVGPIGIEVLNSALRKQPNDIVPARVFDAAWSVCQNI